MFSIHRVKQVVAAVKGLALLSIAAAASPSFAGLLIENSVSSYSQSMKTTATEGSSGLALGNFVGATIPKIFFIGFLVDYFSQSLTNADGVGKTSGTKMGPRVGMWIGKSQLFSLSVAYLPMSNATYTSATGTELDLQGSGYQFQLGFTPQISSKLYAGVAFIYDVASYKTSTGSDNLTTTVSYSRSGWVPAVYLSWRFGGNQ